MDRSEDPNFYYRIVLESAGLIRNKNRFLFGIMSVVTPVLILVELATFIIYILEEHPFFDKTESIQCVISLSHLVAKLINLRFRKARVRKYLEESILIWKEMRKDPQNEKILQEMRNRIDFRIKLIMVMYITTTPISALIACFKNMSREPEDRELIFKTWDPIVGTLGEDYYFSRNFFQLICFGHGLYIFGAVLTSFSIPCVMATCQMKVLSRMISCKDVDIVQCAKLHQKNLKFVKDIKEMYCGQMFLEVVLSTIQSTFRSYQMILMLIDYDARVFGVFQFLLLCMSGALLICISGQIITDGSEQVFQEMYQNDWYNFDKKDSKSLFIMLTCATRIQNMGYKNIVTFNMERFALVVQATYSYITILLNY